MTAIIDTSSLLAIVRYYLPFGKGDDLLALLQEKFEKGELVVLDKVEEESRYIAKGIILEKLPFLKDKKQLINTGSLVPTKTFFNMLENQFCNKDIRRLKGITDVEFEIEKTKYIESADGTILLYSHLNKTDDLFVVTEESGSNNDNKIFKKIPECCKINSIICCSVPTLLKDHFMFDPTK